MSMLWVKNIIYTIEYIVVDITNLSTFCLKGLQSVISSGDTYN